MTRAQRAEYAEWARQRANDLQLFDVVDFMNPEMFAKLSGEDLQAYLAASLIMEKVYAPLREARDNFLSLAERIEANAD